MYHKLKNSTANHKKSNENLLAMCKTLTFTVCMQKLTPRVPQTITRNGDKCMFNLDLSAFANRRISVLVLFLFCLKHEAKFQRVHQAKKNE